LRQALIYATRPIKFRQFSCGKQIINQQEIYQPVCVADVHLSDIQNLKSNILLRLSYLNDDPYIINEFCHTSCIQAIRSMDSKSQVIIEISSIVDGYISALSELNKKHSEQEPDCRTLINRVLSLRNKYSFNLDNLKQLTFIFNHELAKLNQKASVDRPDTGLLKKPILFRPETPTSRPGTPIRPPESPTLRAKLSITQ
jgi:hypothetical protein